MKQYFNFLWLFLTVFVFVGLFFLLKETFFFNDEWTLLYKIIISPRDFLLMPHNEHFIPLLNLLYLVEYKFFGLDYPFYQLVLLLLHFSNAYLLYLIIYRLSKKQILGILAFFLFLINSLYWEVIFSSATQPTVLCLSFMGLAIIFYLKYQKDQKLLNLVVSGIFSLFASYSWGLGLFFPFLFLVIIFSKKISRKKVNVWEVLTYLVAGAISLTTYRIFVRSSFGIFDLKQVLIFSLTGIKWIILGFYTASPGRLKFFLIAFAGFSLLTFNIFANKNLRSQFLNLISHHKHLLFFSIANFLYIYLIFSLPRYRMGIELATVSRYTYIPLFFLIIINLILLDVFLPLFSKKTRLIFIAYLVFLFTSHVYFFRIYYQSWTETVSGPNRAIFSQITKVTSVKDLDKIELPLTFSSFLKAKDIYFIYQHSK